MKGDVSEATQAPVALPLLAHPSGGRQRENAFARNTEHPPGRSLVAYRHTNHHGLVRDRPGQVTLPSKYLMTKATSAAVSDCFCTKSAS
jgi:hypothetical protein